MSGTSEFPASAPAGSYVTNLSAFDGTDPNGTWSLYVIDDCSVDEGGFSGGWSLEISTGGTDPQPDSDSDGVADFEDNCPDVANANQANGDADGEGDACDSPKVINTSPATIVPPPT